MNQTPHPNWQKKKKSKADRNDVAPNSGEHSWKIRISLFHFIFKKELCHCKGHFLQVGKRNHYGSYGFSKGVAYFMVCAQQQQME